MQIKSRAVSGRVFLKPFLQTGVLLCGILITSCSTPVSEKNSGPYWSRNTFPSPGHVTNPGPWGEFQGSDRAEWLSAFGVHPANPNFMLQSADLGRLVYTNTRLGGVEFVPAELPLANGATIAFHPHEPKTGYALMYTDDAPGQEGWWRTTDEGETWEHFKFVGDASIVFDHEKRKTYRDRRLFSRGLRSLLVVNPDPERKTHLYIGTPSNGVIVSTDNGESWNPLALEGESIFTLRVSSDGHMLYAVTGKQEYLPPWRYHRVVKGGTLYRIPLGKEEAIAEKVLDDPVFGVTPHPVIGDEVVLVVGDQVIPFQEYGRLRGKPRLEMPGISYVKINPANPKHWIAAGRGRLKDNTFRWSTDGGQTWNHWDTKGETIPNLVDYSPINHNSPRYEIPNDDYMTVQSRLLTDFIPGDPDSVLFWGLNFLKAPMRSDDYGKHFKPFAYGGSFKRVSQIAFGASDKVQGHAITEYGFRLTEDGGRSWKGISLYNTKEISETVAPPKGDNQEYYSSRSAWGIGFHPENEQVLIGTFGRTPTKIFRSEDFGKSWKLAGTFEKERFRFNGQFVFWHGQSPEVVYAGDVRSEDGGNTFPHKTAHPISAMSPTNGDLILSKEHHWNWFVSKDRGNTFLKLPRPPGNPYDTTASIDGNTRKWGEFDPSPKHNPANGNPIRIVVGGLNGAWEYIARAPDLISGGEWQPLNEGQAWEKDPVVDALGKGKWLGGVSFDPRPGHHHIAYLYPVKTAAGRGRGDLFFRQLYRSEDGGRTWSRNLYQFPGEVPQYLCVDELRISPHSGDLILQDYAGQYTLKGIGSLGAVETLESEHARVDVQISPNPRILTFYQPGQPNLLFSSHEKGLQGLRTWYMEPGFSKASRRPANQPVQHVERGNHHLRLESEKDPETELQLTTEIFLSEESPTMKVRHGLLNGSDRTREIALWPLIMLPDAGNVEIPWERNRTTYNVLQYWPRVDPAYGGISVGEEGVFIDLSVIPERYMKLGTRSPKGRLMYHRDGVTLRSKIPEVSDAVYPEGNVSITVYHSGRGFAEMEHVGPLTSVPPGETLWLEQTLELIHTGDAHDGSP